MNRKPWFVTSVCHKAGRQSPITTRGKNPSSDRLWRWVLNPHAVLSMIRQEAIFAYIRDASKCFFLQLNCAIRLWLDYIAFPSISL
jgi:hypothetical protein